MASAAPIPFERALAEARAHGQPRAWRRPLGGPPIPAGWLRPAPLSGVPREAGPSRPPSRGHSQDSSRWAPRPPPARFSRPRQQRRRPRRRSRRTRRGIPVAGGRPHHRPGLRLRRTAGPRTGGSDRSAYRRPIALGVPGRHRTRGADQDPSSLCGQPVGPRRSAGCGAVTPSERLPRRASYEAAGALSPTHQFDVARPAQSHSSQP